VRHLGASSGQMPTTVLRTIGGRARIYVRLIYPPNRGCCITRAIKRRAAIGKRGSVARD